MITHLHQIISSSECIYYENANSFTLKGKWSTWSTLAEPITYLHYGKSYAHIILIFKKVKFTVNSQVNP